MTAVNVYTGNRLADYNFLVMHIRSDRHGSTPSWPGDKNRADLHEDGRFLYPGTGTGSETGRGVAKGTKLNIPMPRCG